MADNKKPWRKIVKDKNYADVVQRDNMNQAESLFSSMISKVDQMIEILQRSETGQRPTNKNGKSN